MVSDSGPLISLEKIRNGYDFIRKLYKKIIVPLSVIEELSYGLRLPPNGYLEAYNIKDLVEIRPVIKEKQPEIKGIECLHLAEADAILLAMQMQCPLLIEETISRRLALEAGLKISGIAGTIVRALRQGVIVRDEAVTKTEELLNGGQRLTLSVNA
ncbi:MAG: hypothetical protein HQK96_07975 [Nitrospirae bacterium]|nr:hypothetical protein [Nitrospirota bacterium]